MSQKKQKVVIATNCFLKDRLLQAGGGYELLVSEVKELRGAGRVLRILKEGEKMPSAPKETAASKQSGKETADAK